MRAGLSNLLQKGPQCSCFAKHLLCWIRLLANVALDKDNKQCFALALKSLSSIC